MKKLFGKIDRTEKDKIKSEYPSWYFPQHKEELVESIRHNQSMLEMDLIPASEIPITKANLEKAKEKLEEIEESEPRFTDAEKDAMVKLRKGLGSKISDSMFRRSEMEKGIADAHEEARRISEPVMKVDSQEEADLYGSCGINIRDGKVTRNDAERAWKIISRGLGEISNSESLRKA